MDHPAITIKLCTVAEIESAPNLADLLTEYAQESAIDGLGYAAPQFDTYHAMESAGFAHFIAAYRGDYLIGFLIMIASVLPHFGVLAASTESFFVASAERKTGAGLGLLRFAMAHAKHLGARGFFVSAPCQGRLETLLPAIGFRETNRIFFVPFGSAE